MNDLSSEFPWRRYETNVNGDSTVLNAKVFDAGVRSEEAMKNIVYANREKWDLVLDDERIKILTFNFENDVASFIIYLHKDLL